MTIPLVKVLYLIDLNDIWIYIHKKEETKYTDLINEFVKTGKRSKVTILNYKKQLEAAGKIKKRISPKTNRPVYYVPEMFREEVEKLERRKNLGQSHLLSRYPDSWKEELEQTHKLLNFIVTLNPEEMQRLHDLLEKFIKLQELERKAQEQKYEIVDNEDTIVLRNRKTGLIYRGIVIHLIPIKKLEKKS